MARAGRPDTAVPVVAGEHRGTHQGGRRGRAGDHPPAHRRTRPADEGAAGGGPGRRPGPGGRILVRAPPVAPRRVGRRTVRAVAQADRPARPRVHRLLRPLVRTRPRRTAARRARTGPRVGRAVLPLGAGTPGGGGRADRGRTLPGLRARPGVSTPGAAARTARPTAHGPRRRRRAGHGGRHRSLPPHPRPARGPRHRFADPLRGRDTVPLPAQPVGEPVPELLVRLPLALRLPPDHVGRPLAVPHRAPPHPAP